MDPRRRALYAARLWLRKRLGELQMGIGDFASACEKHRQTARRWLMGESTPTVEDQITIAVVLHLDVDEVLARFSAEAVYVADAGRGLVEDDVNRRDFLITGSAAVATANMLLHGFSEALFLEPRPRDWWVARVDEHGAAYMTAGADEMRARISSDLINIKHGPMEDWKWAIAARLMALYAKSIPGTDGSTAVSWYRMAAVASDRSDDVETRVWVRGRAAIALGYEGASSAIAHQFASEATSIATAGGVVSMGLLNAQMGGAHAAAALGDLNGSTELYDAGRRTFDALTPTDAVSDFAVPWWRQGVYSSLLLARLGKTTEALRVQSEARQALPSNLPRFATHLDLHTALLIGKAGDKAGARALSAATLARLPQAKHSLTLRLLAEEIKSI